MASPPVQETCECDANPVAAKYAGCKDDVPLYFNSLDDIPNGACLYYADGKKEGNSLTTCQADSDCAADLTCNKDKLCSDPKTGVVEIERLVQTCVSPKATSKSVYAGCPFGGNQGGDILKCHKYWISDEAMQWKRYIQHNPLGEGDAYAWAYDEAVCSVASGERSNLDYPWCVDQDEKFGAVDDDGKVIDTSCPCAVMNHIAPLAAVPFADQGYGVHMQIHVFDVMGPGYVKPNAPIEFNATKLAKVESESDQFYMKIVNEMDRDMLAYSDAPPARYNETVSGIGQDGRPATW